MKRFSFALLSALSLGLMMMPGGATRAAPAQATTTCPAALSPGSAAPEGVLTAARRAIPDLYPGSGHRGYQITLIASLRPGSYQALNQQNWVLRQIAIHQCGVTVANRSWLVLVVFPHLRRSASMYSAQLFVARTRSRWDIWFRFH